MSQHGCDRAGGRKESYVQPRIGKKQSGIDGYFGLTAIDVSEIAYDQDVLQCFAIMTVAQSCSTPAM